MFKVSPPNQSDIMATELQTAREGLVISLELTENAESLLSSGL
jgi:hypothetical protein